MIKYNFRYRGPFEYEKFILNVLQFSNEVRYLKETLKDNEYDLLCKDGSHINDLFDKLTLPGGIMDQLNRLDIKLSEKGYTNGN